MRGRYGMLLPCTSVAALAMLQAPTRAAVVEQHLQRPYPVYAQPGQSLRQALHAASPIVVGGRRFHGHAHWTVEWSYDWWREPSGRCTITEVTTHLRTEVQLPELRRSTPAQQAAFDRYLPALSRHEQGHVQLGREAAQAIDQGIARLPAAPDCATLERQAEDLGRRLLQDHMERNRQYDLRTDHGASQGALLD